MNKEMMSLVFIMMLAAIMSLMISNLSYVLSKKNPYKEKTSVYECGFSPFKSTSAPFSIKFFLVAIMFLIFDLEMMLLFPWSSSLLYLPKISHFTMIFFLIFITLGLMYEWYKGALEW